MRVLIIEPRKCPHVAEIDGSLKSMQEIVGGHIEAICPFADKVAIVCDEESKLKSDTEWNATMSSRVRFSSAELMVRNLPTYRRN